MSCAATARHEPWQIAAQHCKVEKPPCAQRMVVRGRRHFSLANRPRKRSNLLLLHVARNAGGAKFIENNMKILLKIVGLVFLSCLYFSSSAQTIITTNHPNNNGNGSVTFNVQNTNSYDITIVEVKAHLGTTSVNNIQLLYRTIPFFDIFPPWDFGTVGDGQNGWISAGVGVISNSNTANGIVTALSSLSLTIPAGAEYQLGLSASTLQYSTLGAGAGVNSFFGDGVNIRTGDGISWGGVSYPSTPANYPRGLIGGITFIPTGLHFAISAPSAATAGTAFNFTVTALDGLNNPMTGYTGTVQFTSTDGTAVLPANTTLINGVGTFSATLKTAGSQTITATDTVAAPLTETSGPISVAASTTGAHFTISAPSAATAGTAFNFTATALDAFNNTMTGYTGTVHFTSTDPAAVLPANATLTNGVGTFSATLRTQGSQTLAATDTVDAAITGVSGLVAVAASAAVAAIPVPLHGELWEKLLQSLMLAGACALYLRKRKA